MATPVQLVTGLGGAIGCDFRKAQNQLIFVEFAGKLSSLDLFKPATIVFNGATILKGTFTLELDNGVQGGVSTQADIWWDQQTTVKRQMVPQTTAKIVNLGLVNYAALTADALQTLTYSTTPIPGSNDASNKLVAGDVFAVITNKGNFAKVRVDAYGYDLKIEWVTYRLDSPYKVLGTGYVEPEDVKVSADNVHAYITERGGTLLRATLANGNRAAATVVTSGMTAPHQIFLDEPNNAAYIVEFAAPGRLIRVNLTNGARTPVLSNLDHGVGVVLSSDKQFAYISEQTTGPDQGRVSRYRLSDGTRQPLATGLTAPFMLTWGDVGQTMVFVAERDPANRIRSINVQTGVSQIIAHGVPVRPSSVALINPSEMLICSDQIIERLVFSSGVFQPAGPLLMGIGFVPFDKVTVAGKADTSVDPAYFFQVKDVPFGGTLPLMINHLRAFNDGAVYYRVKVDGVIRLDSWTDERWNGTQYVPQTSAPQNVAAQPGFFPVHPLSELFLWMNPSLGMLMDSRNLTNGLHTITIEFVNGLGGPVEMSTPLKILVDNNSCSGSLATPVLNGIGADPTCGILKYAAKNADQVHMAFTASHPNAFATFSFILVKGVNAVVLPALPPTSGPVSAAVSPINDTVAHLMGACNVAGFGEYLYVAATTINGWNRQSQYDASAALAFVLAP